MTKFRAQLRVIYSIFENSIDIIKYRARLTVIYSKISIDMTLIPCRGTFHSGMKLSTSSISSHNFALSFPEGLKPMEMYSLTYKRMIIPKLPNVGLTPNNLQHGYLFY